MFRLISSIFMFCLTTSAAVAASDRVALFVADTEAPPNACQLDHIAATLRDLKFETKMLRFDAKRTDLLRFAKRTESADAAMLYVCNPAARSVLPAFLKARKLNFLFLLDTTAGKHSGEIKKLVKTNRNDLMIVHARLNTPENEEIFSQTLTHKLRRPYSPPADILSRTVVSSYYRSRGSMLMDVRGSIKSGYIITKPPTEKILDAWSRVQHSKDRQALEGFIAKYPQTLFADLARSRLEKLPQ